jgi:hypothetical protein
LAEQSASEKQRRVVSYPWNAADTKDQNSELLVGVGVDSGLAIDVENTLRARDTTAVPSVDTSQRAPENPDAQVHTRTLGSVDAHVPWEPHQSEHDRQ